MAAASVRPRVTSEPWREHGSKLANSEGLMVSLYRALVGRGGEGAIGKGGWGVLAYPAARDNGSVVLQAVKLL